MGRDQSVINCGALFIALNIFSSLFHALAASHTKKNNTLAYLQCTHIPGTCLRKDMHARKTSLFRQCNAGIEILKCYLEFFQFIFNASTLSKCENVVLVLVLVLVLETLCKNVLFSSQYNKFKRSTVDGPFKCTRHSKSLSERCRMLTHSFSACYAYSSYFREWVQELSLCVSDRLLFQLIGDDVQSCMQ